MTHTASRRAQRLEQQAAEQRARALAAADQRMAQAKHRFGLAALACLRRTVDCEQLVAAALREIDAARSALREAGDA